MIVAQAISTHHRFAACLFFFVMPGMTIRKRSRLFHNGWSQLILRAYFLHSFSTPPYRMILKYETTHRVASSHFRLQTKTSERHTNRERRPSDDATNTVASFGGRCSRRSERARRFHKQDATLLLPVPITTRVAACDDDPTDGTSYWALTTSEAPDDHRLE